MLVFFRNNLKLSIKISTSIQVVRRIAPEKNLVYTPQFSFLPPTLETQLKCPPPSIHVT